MPKKRQIPNLFPRARADGTTGWNWKPSAKLRRAGFINVQLGTDEADAIRQALDLNRQVAGWQEGNAGAATPAPAPVRRLVSFAELVLRYRASSDFTDLAKKTRDEYEVRLRQLEHWAMDGALHVRDIDMPMVLALREQLMGGSRFRAAAILRVLRLLLAWAERNGIIPRGSNPGTSIRIPEPPGRKVRMPAVVRDAIVEAAEALDPDDINGVALAVDLGFWMIQRQADILAAGRMAWREIDVESLDDVDPRHVAQLVNARGRVMGFRLQQQKTGTWVDAPLPPFLHDRVEARLRRSNSGWLFPDRTNPDHVAPGWKFQRDFRAARDAAVFVAIGRGDMALAEAIDVCQFRDLRRTGMIAYKDGGAKGHNITALSGHAVLGRKTILDTYMPGDTAGAIACVAAGVRAWLAREARQSKTG